MIKKIDAFCSINNFRYFMIISTCHSFIPKKILNEENVFPERPSEKGTMYVEAEDKQTIHKTREISFVRVYDVLGIFYTSKSGRTRLKWRCLRDNLGKLTGTASGNSLVNLFAAGVLDESYAISR